MPPGSTGGTERIKKVQTFLTRRKGSTLRHIFFNMKVKLEEYRKLKKVAGDGSRGINEAVHLSEEIASVGHKAEVIVILSEDNGTLFFERAEVQLTGADGYYLIMRHESHTKEFSILNPDLLTLENITHGTISQERKKLKEPNKIGVLTSKKIQAHIDYNNQLIKNLRVIDEERQREKDFFIKSLEGLPVVWDNDKKSGRLIINGIAFAFSLEKTFINQKIEVHYSVPNTLEAFQKLSTNQYL